MVVSSKLGISYGWIHHTSTYTQASTDADLAMLASLGFKRIRIAQGWYTDTDTLNMTKSMVQRALLRSEFTEIIFGATPPNPFSGAQWTTYKNTHLPLLAQWCQDQNDSRLIMAIGNEEEDHNTGASAPDDATLQSDIVGLLTSLQSTYTVGKIMYITSRTYMADWAALWSSNNFSANSGLKMGINIYGTPSVFSADIASIVSGFGTQGIATEWSDGGVGTYCYSAVNNINVRDRERVFEEHIRERLAMLNASSLSAYYFFQFNSDGNSFGLSDGFANIRLANGDYRLAWNVLKGGRQSFITL